MTQPPGYVLRIESDQSDLAVFSRRVADARAARADGDLGEARAAFAEALDLWRGSPLGDLADEPFARPAIARLDELHLSAVEDRIDTDLDLGRHRDLLPVLDDLIGRHPLRERLRGQQMLALYRDGRQSEALEVYRQTRQLLAEELGVEPGRALQDLERRILNHDVALDVAPATQMAVPDGTSGEGQRRRRRAATLAALLVLILAVAGAWGFGLFEAEEQALAAAEGNTVALVDAATGDITRQVDVGHHPTSVAVAEGAVWVLNADDQTITRVDEATGTAKTFGVGRTPADLAVGAAAAWVVVDGATALLRLDPATGVVEATVSLASPKPTAGVGVTSAGTPVVTTKSSVWVVDPAGDVVRVDATTNRVVARIPGLEANTLAPDGDGIWVVTRQNALARIDPATNRVAETITVPSDSLTSVTSAAGFLWATDPVGGAVWRIEPGTPRPVMKSIPLAFGAAGIAATDQAVWVANGVAGVMSKIDADTGTVSDTIQMGNAPMSVAATDGGVWTTIGGAHPGSARREGSTRLLPQPPCGHLVYEGPGNPQLLIASDAPLQGASRDNALSMVEAIQIVLADHDYRAGPYTVGYQFCDDATAQAGSFEYEKCAANANTYAEQRNLVGVIGSYNSDCSRVQVGIANQAPDGPLAMVSASNSAIGLTLPAPSVPRDELQRLYPDGSRHFARVFGMDRQQAIAMTRFARSLGVRSVFVLEDAGGSGYPVDMAAAFVDVAPDAGLRIADHRRWAPAATSYRRIAGDIARSEADAVYLAGAARSNGGQLLKDLRAVLPEIPILAADGFSGVEDLRVAAGDAADGLYVSVSGLPTQRLPEEGRRFADELATTRPAGNEPNLYWGLHAAQTAEVLLDAIARSDGTRASVTEKLLQTQLTKTLLGDISFDDNGDRVAAPITILRIEESGTGMVAEGTDFADGAALVRVLTPGPSDP